MEEGSKGKGGRICSFVLFLYCFILLVVVLFEERGLVFVLARVEVLPYTCARLRSTCTVTVRCVNELFRKTPPSLIARRASVASPSFLIVNGGSPAERARAPGRLPCGENGEEWSVAGASHRQEGTHAAQSQQ